MYLFKYNNYDKTNYFKNTHLTFGTRERLCGLCRNGRVNNICWNPSWIRRKYENDPSECSRQNGRAEKQYQNHEGRKESQFDRKKDGFEK